MNRSNLLLAPLALLTLASVSIVPSAWPAPASAQAASSLDSPRISRHDDDADVPDIPLQPIRPTRPISEQLDLTGPDELRQGQGGLSTAFLPLLAGGTAVSAAPAPAPVRPVQRPGSPDELFSPADLDEVDELVDRLPIISATITLPLEPITPTRPLIPLLPISAPSASYEPPADAAPIQRSGLCVAIDQADFNHARVFRYGLDGATLQGDFFDQTAGTYNSAGYRPLRLTGYRDGSKVRFATLWVKQSGPEWYARFGLTGTEFGELFEARKNDWVPIDVSGYTTSQGGLRYNVIWERNVSGVLWKEHRDVSRDGMQDLVDQYAGSGYVPVRVEAYEVAGQSRYISLWVKANCGWKMHNKMTRDQYLDRFELYKNAYRLVHLDSHTQGGQVYYSGIWWQQPNPGWAVRSNRDWYLFQRFANNYWCAGFRISNFYAAEIPGGLRFGGLWSYDEPLNISASSSLSARVRKHVDCGRGRAGAAVLNLTTGQEILVHGDQRFGTSSTIKSAILYALLRRVDADPLVTLNTQLDVGDQYGTNQGNWLASDQSYTLRYLAEAMIRSSNNWATNRLIDYLGENTINQELANLGLTRTRLRRYMTGSGSPGGGSEYRDGLDNTATPREYVRFLRLVHQNQGNLLTAGSHDFFWATMNLDGDGGLNTKGYLPNYLGAGVSPSWPSEVTIFNKAGSNTWSGSPGDFTHRPQLGSHRQRSEAGRLNFDNGPIVFYAMFIDEADTSDTPADVAAALSCIGYEIVTTYSGVSSGSVPTLCQ